MIRLPSRYLHTTFTPIFCPFSANFTQKIIKSHISLCYIVNYYYLCTAFSFREASVILAQTRCCNSQVRCSLSLRSLAIKLGRPNIRSDKSEDLLYIANGVGSLKSFNRIYGAVLEVETIRTFRTFRTLLAAQSG